MKKYFLLICVINMTPFYNTFSQLMTNDNVNITITANTQLSVQGELRNENNTTITNSGTIDLSGNWIHNASNNCFGISQGTVILNGANQAIGGSNSTTFNNLILQGSTTKTMLVNTAVGGANIPPAGVLTIGNAVLDLNSHTITINNSSGSAVTAGTGYILSEDPDNTSRVAWCINSSAGVHTVPFGNIGGVQIPFSFNLTSGNAGTVTASTYATAGDNTPLPVTPVPVTHVRNISGTDNSANTVDRFWQIDPTGNPVATLTFTYAASENAAGGNTNLRAQRWNAAGEAWEAPVAGQIMPTSQSVLAAGITAWGPYALSLETSPLPIELLSFDAAPVNNENVLCKWITASEINNDFFTIERSYDGNSFEPAGTMDGAGNSSSVLYYRFTDRNPYQGISYYRLKQTDYDGNFSYSPAVKVNIHLQQNVSLYPNPASDFIFLELNDLNEKIEIFDAAGKKVAGISLNDYDHKTNNTIRLTTEKLNEGYYIVSISGKGKIQNIPLVIKR